MNVRDMVDVRQVRLWCSSMARSRARLQRAVAVVAALACVAVAASASFTGHYTVRRGDSLSAVAARAGVSVADLVAANHLRDPNLILVGQVLVIDGGREATPHPGVRMVANRPEGGYPIGLTDHPDRLALLSSFRHWAAVSHVPLDLLEAMTWMESGWQNGAVSSSGAIGIGQLEPATARFISSGLLGVRLDPRRPDDNIRMSAAYLAWLLRQTHAGPDAALAAYYQGIGSIARRGVLPETRHYVSVISQLRRNFRAA